MKRKMNRVNDFDIEQDTTPQKQLNKTKSHYTAKGYSS